MPPLKLDWFQENASRFGGELLWDEPLARYTWYRIGGPAKLLALPKSAKDLAWLSDGLAHTQAPRFILGAGSNLLVSDSGFSGVVVRANRINLELGQASADPLEIRAGGSVMISQFLRRAAQEGWGGLEFLTGIPGTVGGAVRMNAGTHLGETQSALKGVEAWDLGSGSMLSYPADALKFEYRRNRFLPEGALVWSTLWQARRSSAVEVKQAIDQTLLRRKQTQPIDLPSCGSVFKNPQAHGISAWQVIDQLGLRGHRIGGAEFSPKHSNFIVNVGQARASDVKALIDLARARARTELGVELEEEVMYVGEFKAAAQPV